MRSLKINYLAVLVGVVISQALPAVWYSIFADKWMAANNLTMEAIQGSDSPINYLISTITGAIAVVTMAYLYKRMKVDSAFEGLMWGLLLGFAFIYTDDITVNMFSMRPYVLTLINGGASTLTTGLVGLVLGAWRKYE
ncbi:MAG: DUF1761 domain-containing protein [Spirosomataceae bacterium]